MSKKLSFITCALYGFIILAVWVAFLFFPAKDFSPTENRMLAQAPSLSAGELIDGGYAEKFSDFCADQFPLRAPLLSLNSSYELALGKSESNKVIYGKNGVLVKRLEYNDSHELKTNLLAIDSICRFAEENGAEAYFFCAPRAIDVLGNYCPAHFEARGSQTLWDTVASYNAITANELLRSKADSGEYVFYKTDHHWTTLGAYYAYSELGKALGYSPYPLSDFDAETVSDSFLGTSYSASLFPSVSPDKITAMRYDGDGKISVTDLNTAKRFWLYDFSALETSSKYDFFLGGNKAHLRVGNRNMPRLVIIKDSFANSLVPFLALHYDIDVIDPRYLREPLENVLSELYSKEDSSALLVLFNLDSLTGDVGLKKID